VHLLPDVKDTQRMLSEACTDKLRVLGEGLLDLLLYLVYEIGPVPRVSSKLFYYFVFMVIGFCGMMKPRCLEVLYILESNPHLVFATFINEKS
jgi:hypothetical protein